MDSSTLQILLLFMYSGRVEVEGINPAKIMKLLTAADLYQVCQQTFLKPSCVVVNKISNTRWQMYERVWRPHLWRTLVRTLQWII